MEFIFLGHLQDALFGNGGIINSILGRGSDAIVFLDTHDASEPDELAIMGNRADGDRRQEGKEEGGSGTADYKKRANLRE
jgi:hypothetical protein